MEKKTKIFFCIIILILLVIITFFRINYLKKDKLKVEEENGDSNMIATMKAVIVKVYDKSLIVIDYDDKELLNVSFTKEGNIGFKQGQEILVHFDGMVYTTYPGQISNVGKIEIIKEKSGIKIPEDALRYCYSSKDNVKVSVNELTSRGITLEIVDTNQLPYNYSHSYSINKKVKNEKYTGIGQKIGEDTETSTSGYTRKWI